MEWKWGCYRLASHLERSKGGRAERGGARQTCWRVSEDLAFNRQALSETCVPDIKPSGCFTSENLSPYFFFEMWRGTFPSAALESFTRCIYLGLLQTFQIKLFSFFLMVN